MGLTEHGRLLYVSMADVTQPNGPGVNEREFLLSLYERFGSRMHALVPKPRRPCSEIDVTRTTSYRHPFRWNPLGFVLQQGELYWKVKRLLEHGRFDLVVVRLSLFPLAFYLLRSMRVPFAIKTLEDVEGFARNKGLKGYVAKALSPVNSWLFRQIVPRAVAVDCCTETYVLRHRRDYQLEGDRLLFVDNVTNVARFAPQPASEAKASLELSDFDPILGFTGGRPAVRGALQMLELAARLVPDFPRLGVVIVGPDDDGVVKCRATQLGLEGRTRIPGLVPYEMIPSYINSFDIGFALDDPKRMRVTGNSYQKVRQYLACGKAVVTCLDKSSELVQRGFVENVVADELGSIEAAVRRILARNPASREQHAANARQFVGERLSTSAAMERRLGFWEHRLAKGLRTASPSVRRRLFHRNKDERVISE